MLAAEISDGRRCAEAGSLLLQEDEEFLSTHYTKAVLKQTTTPKHHHSTDVTQLKLERDP